MPKTQKLPKKNNIFSSSAKSLAELRTLTTTGVLVAMAIALRAVAIQITPDIRITFQFLPICVIAMLYGPVVCMLGAFATDLIGFLFDASGRFYSPQLALVAVLTGLIYGVFLYNKTNAFWICVYAIIARITVVIICNICLNSYFVYTIYVNKSFDVFSKDEFAVFAVWNSVRTAKSVLMLPVDLTLLCIVLPVAYAAYIRVKKERVKRT